MKRTLFGWLAMTLVTVALGAQAAIITSVDRATFAAAVAGGQIESQNFDSIAPGTLLGTLGDVTYSASAGTPVVTAAFLTSTSPNGLGRTDALGDLDFFLPEDTATFSFASPITAFAIDINTFANTDGAYQALLSTGDVVTSLFEVFPNASTGQFIGFVSDTPFTSVTIAAVTGFSYTLDTLIFGDAADIIVVPEPGTLPLVALAIIALAVLRKRMGARGAMGRA